MAEAPLAHPPEARLHQDKAPAPVAVGTPAIHPIGSHELKIGVTKADPNILGRRPGILIGPDGHPPELGRNPGWTIAPQL
jgi:hypothetical protein